MSVRRDDHPSDPSPWVVRFAGLIPADGEVLDLACGGGRHTRYLLERGHRVVAVDRDVSGVADLAGADEVEVVEVDLEDGRPFPLAGRRFAGVVVTNYLHRPLLADLVAAVARGGVLIYETYARGQERLGRPTNPDFLLRRGELLDAVRGELTVVAYEDLTDDRPARVQRICAVREPAEADRTG
jgi:SAM-dependent methyltransferase